MIFQNLDCFSTEKDAGDMIKKKSVKWISEKLQPFCIVQPIVSFFLKPWIHHIKKRLNFFVTPKEHFLTNELNRSLKCKRNKKEMGLKMSCGPLI